MPVDINSFIKNIYKNISKNAEHAFTRGDDIFKMTIILSYHEFISRGVIKGNHKEIDLSYLENSLSSEYSETYSKLKEDITHFNNEEIIELVKENINKARKDNELGRYIDDSGPIVEGIIYKLLDFKDNDIFVDLGSGYGLTLTSEYLKAKEEGNNIGLAGIDLSSEAVSLSLALIAILSKGEAMSNVTQGDLFFTDKVKGNKGYVYSSSGSKLPADFIQSSLFPTYRFHGFRLSQWAYVDRMLSAIDIDRGGRGAALLFSRSLSKTQDNDYLQPLLNKGYIEGIIKLPGILSTTIVNAYLVIFSSGNSKVRLVNGSGPTFFPSDRKSLFFRRSDEFNIDELVAIYRGKESECAADIINFELRKYDNFDPEMILSSSPSEARDNYIPLSSLTANGEKGIFAGSQYTVSQFEVTNNLTGYMILTSSDIDEDGNIDWLNLKNIRMDKTLFDRYALEKGDVVITTKSSKVKIAVVDVTPPGRVIVTGGMIIIRPDESKLNPTYLKIFLESKEGREMLKASQSGSVMVHLSPKSLATNVSIPPIDIEKQNKKANKYNLKKAQIEQCYERIDKYKKELQEICEEE